MADWLRLRRCTLSVCASAEKHLCNVVHNQISQVQSAFASTQLTSFRQLRSRVHISHSAAASKPVAHPKLARHHELQKKKVKKK